MDFAGGKYWLVYTVHAMLSFKNYFASFCASFLIFVCICFCILGNCMPSNKQKTKKNMYKYAKKYFAASITTE